MRGYVLFILITSSMLQASEAEFVKLRDDHLRQYGIANHCHTVSREAHVERLCPGGGSLPLSQTRNISGRYFSCTYAETTKVRTAQDYDFEEWVRQIGSGQEGRWEAFNHRKKQPDVEITGSIPYRTIENWTYETCDLIESSSRCGSVQVCAETWVLNPERNIPGRPMHIKEKTCRQMPLKCHADVSHNSSMGCSNEQIDFRVKYLRPDYGSSWNPESPGYHDEIPNKYDLLQTESETLTISNFSTLFNIQSTVISPSLTIRDPRNVYSIQNVGAAVGAQCAPSKKLGFTALVTTRERIESRTPLSVTTPKFWDGSPVEVLDWRSIVDENGKKVERAYPMTLRLQDQAAGIINTIADKSYSNAEKTQKKAFYKDTFLRVRLVKKRWWAWDLGISKMIIAQTMGIRTTLNALSDDAGQRQADFWEVDLDGQNGGPSIYEKSPIFPLNYLMTSTKFRHELRPGRHYALKVSVYQSGMYFYRQDCSKTPERWYCSVPLKWIFAPRENYYYSEELEIPFTAPEDYDPRSFFTKLVDYTIFLPEAFLHWVGKKLSLY